MTRLAIASVLVVAACAKGGRSKEAAPSSAEPAQPPPPPTQSATPPADPANAKEEARAQGLLGPTDQDLFTDLEGGASDDGKGTQGGEGPNQVRSGGAAAGPQVSVGRAAIKANVELRVLQDALAKRAGELKACYDRALAASKGIAGEITIAFTVKPDGSVADVSVKRSTVKHAALDACVVSAIAATKLDKPLDTNAVTGSVPVTFRLR